jgi:glycosyltransferase involved in cell wall biosynthesis
MKVLHVPFTFYPNPIGGTEVYVDALARAQRALNIDALIAAPAERGEHYEHAGLPVWRFPVGETIHDLREMYGEGDALASDAFVRILETARPDLIHLHAFTRAVSLRLVRAAKQRGIPVVFSYHTPTVSCQRGTLLQWGAEGCDGVLHVERCSQCALHGQGLNRTISALVGLLPPGVGRALGSRGLSGGIWTALRMTELVALQHAAFRLLMAEVDHVVALCQWVREVLLRNGVPDEKVTVSRQGLCPVEDDSPPPRAAKPSQRVRMIFLGRLDSTKGTHILIEAMRTAPKVPVDLDIYGIAQGEVGAAYLQRLRHGAQGDGRISFHDSIPARAVVSKIREYDLAAVPSQTLETGPMVVLEAFAAGVPVIGSNLGGIAELVTHGVNGLLVEPGSIVAWARELRNISMEPCILGELRLGIRPPRHISECVSDMTTLYQRLVPAQMQA